MIADRTTADTEYTIIRTSEDTVEFSFDRRCILLKNCFTCYKIEQYMPIKLLVGIQSLYKLSIKQNNLLINLLLIV